MKGYELYEYLKDRGALDQEIYVGTRNGSILSRLYEEDVALVYADETNEGDVVMILV